MEPSRWQLAAIEREFAKAFPPDDYAGEPVLMPLDSGEIARAGGVRWECYQAQRDDWHNAVERAQKAEDKLKRAESELWIYRFLSVLAALLIWELLRLLLEGK